MKTQIKTETKIKSTYWQEHKIIEAEPEYFNRVILDQEQSKQKNIIKRYGTLENYYKNI